MGPIGYSEKFQNCKMPSKILIRMSQCSNKEIELHVNTIHCFRARRDARMVLGLI